MSSDAIHTVIKMLESLPEPTQNQVVAHLRNYLADLQDEIHWDDMFKKTQSKLIVKAQQAKQHIAEEKSNPLRHEDL